MLLAAERRGKAMRQIAEQEAVLAANEAFYGAFARRDLAAMDRLWARSAEVTCLHPGWDPCRGRDAVMASWAGILGNAEAPNIRCLRSQAAIYGDVAAVVCYEAIEESYLIATNLFVREGGAWKLVHHQAGPLAAEPPEPEAKSGPGQRRLH